MRKNTLNTVHFQLKICRCFLWCVLAHARHYMSGCPVQAQHTCKNTPVFALHFYNAMCSCFVVSVQSGRQLANIARTREVNTHAAQSMCFFALHLFAQITAVFFSWCFLFVCGAKWLVVILSHVGFEYALHIRNAFSRLVATRAPVVPLRVCNGMMRCAFACAHFGSPTF